ncbi:Uncharacterised protein [Serratia ficaria]|nr:Uncharacterised protein [Serratia ficaria]
MQPPAVVPLVAGHVAFGIGLRAQLALRVIGVGGHAAGTVGIARQQPARVPLQLHFAAQRIDHPARQALFVIRVVIERGVVQRVHIAGRPAQRIPVLAFAAAVGIGDGEQPAAVAGILIGRFAAERVGFTQQAAVGVPFALALGAAGQQHAAQLAVLIDKTVAPLVEVGELRHVVVVIQLPVRPLAVFAGGAAAATGEIVAEVQPFAGAVAIRHHPRHTLNLLPQVFVQQPGGVLVAGHQAVAPAETPRHLAGAVAHRHQLAMLIVAIVRQRQLAFGGLQRHLAQATVQVAARQALPAAVHQFEQPAVVVVKQRAGVADGVGDHAEAAGLVARQRRVVINLFADVKQLPAAVGVVHQPALFGFAVGFVPARYHREGNIVTGRRAPHQAVLPGLQAALPEQAPAAPQHAVAGVAAAPVTLPGHRQTRRQHEIEFVLAVEEFLAADDIHRPGDDAGRGGGGHQGAKTAGDAPQLVDAGQLAEHLAQCAQLADGAAHAAHQASEQQRQVGSLVQPVRHFGFNRQRGHRAAADEHVGRAFHHLRVAVGFIPHPRGRLAVDADLVGALRHLHARAVVAARHLADGGDGRRFAVDEDVGRTGDNLALRRQAAGPGVGNAVTRRGGRLAGEIAHRQAGADQQHAHAHAGCRQAGDEQRARRHRAGGGDQAADEGAGDHPGQGVRMPDGIADARRFGHGKFLLRRVIMIQAAGCNAAREILIEGVTSSPASGTLRLRPP